MTPREAADRLFNRVMTAAAQEDTAQASTFLPMAMDAYDLARPLDEDGLFHLSLLQRAAGEIEASLATAQEGLESNPDHLLNLSAAAEASLQLGNVDAGLGYYRRMLEAWDREIAVGRPEYEEHAPLLPLLREDAEAVVSGQ
jgi:tetratricopeptide (TPR) repeat protein